MHRVVASIKALECHTRDPRLCRTAARFASTNISKEFSGGLFSWLTGGTFHQLPPQDVKIPDPFPYYEDPRRTKITTLENGVRIASTPAPGCLGSMGLCVCSGSIYETPASFGASHLLKNMAFKSTVNRSHECIAREIENLEATVTASASREQMVYTYEGVMGPFVPIMAEVLIDCVRNPVFLDQEIAEQVQKIKTEIEEAAANDPHSLLLEALHSTGFSGALANPLLASESSICRLNSAVLEEFVAENYTAPRMVLAALGADHWKVVSIGERLLSDLPKVVRPEEPKSVYVGGEYQCQAESSNAHVALAFEVPGGWENEKVPWTLPVLQMLVGGGGSFSAGFLGREMYSNRRVLNEFPQIKAFSAFSRVYNNTGLFGIQATSSPAFVSKTIDLAARELLALASSGQVDQGELDQAKASTRSAVLTNLYGKLTVEDIGRQILAYGKSSQDWKAQLKIPPQHTLQD